MIVTNPIVVGSSVQWLEWLQEGTGTVAMRRRDGVVVSINERKAIVKRKDGYCIRMPINRLRLSDRPTPSTKFAEAQS